MLRIFPLSRRDKSPPLPLGFSGWKRLVLCACSFWTRFLCRCLTPCIGSAPVKLWLVRRKMKVLGICYDFMCNGKYPGGPCALIGVKLSPDFGQAAVHGQLAFRLVLTSAMNVLQRPIIHTLCTILHEDQNYKRGMPKLLEEKEARYGIMPMLNLRACRVTKLKLFQAWPTRQAALN